MVIKMEPEHEFYAVFNVPDKKVRGAFVGRILGKIHGQYPLVLALPTKKITNPCFAVVKIIKFSRKPRYAVVKVLKTFTTFVDKSVKNAYDVNNFGLEIWRQMLWVSSGNKDHDLGQLKRVDWEQQYVILQNGLSVHFKLLKSHEFEFKKLRFAFLSGYAYISDWANRINYGCWEKTWETLQYLFSIPDPSSSYYKIIVKFDKTTNFPVSITFKNNISKNELETGKVTYVSQWGLVCLEMPTGDDVILDISSYEIKDKNIHVHVEDMEYVFEISENADLPM